MVMVANVASSARAPTAVAAATVAIGWWVVAFMAASGAVITHQCQQLVVPVRLLSWLGGRY
jgi:hypothetical protein